MQSHTLTTEARTQTGKGPARQLRAAGKLPAVFYGAGTEPKSLAVSPKELTAALSTEFGRNAVVTLNIDGKQELALVQDLLVHPVTRKPLHVDFHRVDPEQTLVREVPVVVEGKAKGVVAGGEITLVYRALPLSAKPGHHPARLTLDVSNLDIGDHIKVKELPLPAGVTVALPLERNVVSCATIRKRAEEEVAAPGAPGAAPAAGAAAAPAAAAAKPAAKK
jgi:large subunit ribosomal protein L25